MRFYRWIAGSFDSKKGTGAPKDPPSKPSRPERSERSERSEKDQKDKEQREKPARNADVRPGGGNGAPEGGARQMKEAKSPKQARPSGRMQAESDKPAEPKAEPKRVPQDAEFQTMQLLGSILFSGSATTTDKRKAPPVPPNEIDTGDKKKKNTENGKRDIILCSNICRW